MGKALLFFSIVAIIYIIYQLLNEPKPQNNSFKKPEHRLIKLLNNISSADKVVLKNVTEKWSLNKNLIDNNLKQKVTDLIKKILNGINGISEEEFFIESIDNLYLMKDKDGNF